MLRWLYCCLKVVLIVSLLVIATGAYFMCRLLQDLPSYSQLANYQPPAVTRIYAASGKLIEEYALEHRVFVPISSIPRSLIEAFVAAEDKNFFSHPGVDVVGIIRATLTNIINLMQNKRLEGGSTITQQVVKNFLLTAERSLQRKIKEAILSYMISEVFSKERILELYLNQIFLGKGAYGIGVAAQNYFNKSVDELSLAESAFLAGLPKAPANYDPKKHYARAKARRDYVLIRMLKDKYITQEVAEAAIKLPIITRARPQLATVRAKYYAQAVREEVIKMVGKDTFYTGGLTIITSLDPKMQHCAEYALRKGIRNYDLQTGYRGPVGNIDTGNWQENLQTLKVPAGLCEYRLAVVLAVDDLQATIGLTSGKTSKVLLADMQWARSGLESAKKLLKIGDIVVVEEFKESCALRQIPQVNGGIMVMKPSTGQVLAMQGGYDFEHSKFNRVTQALRQPGSLSKTFVYLAALENGIQPNKIFKDEAIEIEQGVGTIWRPKNYKGDFLGSITMRTGLERSRNLIAVKVAQTIGLSKVVEIIKRFKINTAPQAMYSMVLGSIETTLARMTTAYAIIANSGSRVRPHFVELIKDRSGKIIYSRDTRRCTTCLVTDEYLEVAQVPEIKEPQARMITDEASAYQVTSMLSGVIERGTGTAAKKLKKVIAGKTGTTNDSKDTWFIGYTPRIIVGTYIGYDTPRDMGKTATGASVALPVFIDFMKNADADMPSLAFKVPATIKLVSVDPKAGILSADKGAIIEAFKVNEITGLGKTTLDNDPVGQNTATENVLKPVGSEEDQSAEIY